MAFTASSNERCVTQAPMLKTTSFRFWLMIAIVAASSPALMVPALAVAENDFLAAGFNLSPRLFD